MTTLSLVFLTLGFALIGAMFPDSESPFLVGLAISATLISIFVQ